MIVEPAEDKSLDKMTMDDLTAQDEFPAPNEHAIAAMQEKKADHDKSEEFDPGIHASNDDGTPKKTKDGSFAKKRGAKKGEVRRKPKNEFKSPDGKKSPDLQPSDVPSVPSLAAATVISGILEQISVKAVSDDFILTEPERASNVKAWEMTFDYYGGVNISPPAALALNHAAIILTRVGKPATNSKIKLGWAWVKSKITFKRGGNAHVGNRTDAKRENDMGEEKSAKPPEHRAAYDNFRPI